MNEGTTQRGDQGRQPSSGFFSYQNPVADTSLHTALLGTRNTSSAGGSMISNSSPSTSAGGANPAFSHSIAVDMAPPRSPHTTSQQDVLIAGASYILSSAGLILFNKHALSSFNFQCPNCLLFFHCLLSALLVKFVELMGWSKQPIEPLKLRIVQLWLPVNLIFVGMIATSFLALRLVGVGMFTVLKNLSNLLAIGGDYVFFGRTYPAVIWLCIALMIGSALVGGITDVHFNMEGYGWQLVNCLFTSAYALYLSHVMVRVQQYTQDQKRMGELSMVYYNNLLSLGPIALLALGFGEVQRLPYQAALRNPEFLIVAMVGGLLGFLISFASLWFMSRSSATVYSLTGSMNKIFVALAGIILFQEHATWGNLASIAVGLAAGTVFVMAKAYVVK